MQNIERQNYTDIEVVICEDNSPSRNEITQAVLSYKVTSALDIQYFENEINLGYDKNLRELILKATGRYILFMGDDDTFEQEALPVFSTFLRENDKLGYVLKSHYFIHNDGRKELFKYFSDHTFFESGVYSVTTLFRKSVLISGFCIKRQYVLPLLIDDFDGTLLFQLYLLAEVCLHYPSAFCAIPLTVQTESLRQVPLFGSAESEAHLYEPGTISPSNSINFMKGFFKITNFIDQKYNIDTTSPLKIDFSKYSYPILAIQRNKGIKTYLSYVMRLKTEIQIAKTIHFYIYGFSLLIFGTSFCNRMIIGIKNKLGKTPKL